MLPEKKTKKIVFRSNAKEVSNLIVAGKKAALNAIRENKALGLSFTYNNGNKVVSERTNGEILELKTIPLRSSLKIKKGTILYIKSK
jgi:hypothetical protein